MSKRDIDILCSAPAYTITEIGQHRSDGQHWGWRSSGGYWLWFRTQQAAESFNSHYQNIYRNSRATQDSHDSEPASIAGSIPHPGDDPRQEVLQGVLLGAD